MVQISGYFKILDKCRFNLTRDKLFESYKIKLCNNIYAYHANKIRTKY